ncbi:nuclear transport factor 2 family protein [Sphingomonas oryzagri]|jgi:hypothetical protein
MDVVKQLETYDAIRTVKAKYCRFLDSKDWQGLESIFTPDIVLDVSEDTGKPPFEGREAAIDCIRWSVTDAKSAHQIHFSEITLDGEDAADVITPMQDRVVWATGKCPVPGVASITGFGHYRERYVKQDGAWKIAHLQLTRLHVDVYPEPVAG